jgi:hypothetical protein
MRSISKLVLPAIAAIGLVFSMAARADQLIFTLAYPTEYSGSGTVSFDATVTAPITNTDAVYLYGDTNNVTSPLTVDDSPYIDTWPLDLTPGQSYSGVLFNVTVPIDTPPGNYVGSFTIVADSSATPTIDVTQPFDVDVSPEPPTLLLLLTGLLGVTFALRGRRLLASQRSRCTLI